MRGRGRCESGRREVEGNTNLLLTPNIIISHKSNNIDIYN